MKKVQEGGWRVEREQGGRERLGIGGGSGGEEGEREAGWWLVAGGSRYS